MKTHGDFKKDAYAAAKLACQAGLKEVFIAFDYKIFSGPEEKPVPKFLTLTARLIVDGVDAGELPLGD